MNKYLTEFIGTFFLVFTIGCTVMGGAAGVIPPLAIGAALMVMVYAGGHVSGAHYNPAVTVALLIRGKCPAGDVVPYWAAQLAGAGLAAAAALYVTGKSPAPGPLSAVGPAFAAEFLFTFALALWTVGTVGAQAFTDRNAYPLGVALRIALLVAYALVAAYLARRIVPPPAQDGPIAAPGDAVLPDGAPTPNEAA